MSFNKSQQEAIDAPLGQNVLIAAGAGSGKTATLSHKVYKLVKEDHVDPSSLLVLTFTNKAAFEMKDRIIRKFREDRDDPDHLAEKIVSAHIQTFDSFSLYLAKKYASLLGLPENIAVMDEALLDAKRKAALDSTIHDFYEKEFDRTVTSFRKFNLKQDNKSKQMILAIDDELNKLLPAKKNAFIENYDENYLTKENYEKCLTHFIEGIKEQIRQKIMMVLLDYRTQGVTGDSLPKYLDAMADWKFTEATPFAYPANNTLYTALYTLYNTPAKAFFRTLSDYRSDERNKDLFNGHRHAVKTIEKATNPADAIVYKPLKAIFDEYLMPFVSKYETDFDKGYDMLVSFKDDIHLIFDIIQVMNRRLTEDKQTVNAYTFSDVGNMALSLLTDRKYESASREIKERFTYVLVDEYQDTNDVQETFLNAISEKATLFCVGDAKQSIYAFRNSNVQLFMDRKEAYLKDPSAGKVISMNWNYRSDFDLLADINAIFYHYMILNHGGIDFTAEGEDLGHAPDFHREHLADASYGIHWLRFGSNPFYDDKSQEQMAILQDIRQKIASGYRVIDGDSHKPRPCRYSDFAILIRKKRSFEDYEEAFSAFGIPFNDEVSGYLTQVNAVVVLESLLTLVNDDLFILRKLLSHENRKHLFMSIARSYLYGPNAGYDDQRIHDLVVSKDSLFEKDPIMTSVFGFAKAHQDSPLSVTFSDLLQTFRIIEKLNHVGSIRDNIAKIESFFTMIRQQESEGLALNDFVSVLKSLSKYDIEISADTINERDNAVKLMTIHKSKGLEFPIVYLPYTDNCLSTPSNMDKPMSIFSKDYGILLPNFRLGAKVKNLFFATYDEGEGSNKGDVDEQVRINYVALTRAKETIYIVGNRDARTSTKESLYDMLYALPHYATLNPQLVEASLDKGLLDSRQYDALVRNQEAYRDFMENDKGFHGFENEEEFYALRNHFIEMLQNRIQDSIKDISDTLFKNAALRLGTLDDERKLRLVARMEYIGPVRDLMDFATRMANGREPDPMAMKAYIDLSVNELIAAAKAKKLKYDENLIAMMLSVLADQDFDYYCQMTFDPGVIKAIDVHPEQAAGPLTQQEVILPSLTIDDTPIDFPVAVRKQRASMATKFNKDEDLQTLRNTQYGTYLHRLLELCDFTTKDTSFIQADKDRSLVDAVLALPVFDGLDDALVYHEYSYWDETFNSEGIIDCLIVRKDSIDIIDYKTRDIDKPEYVRQLAVYARNVKALFPDKPIHTYLLSILKKECREIDISKAD